MGFLVISRQAKSQHVNGEGSRIPASLQAVFIASNRGADVVKPPPQKSAFKMFSSPKTWFGSSNKNNTNPTKPGHKKGKKQVIPSNRKSVKKEDSGATTCSSTMKDSKNSIPANIAVPRPIKKKAPLPTLTPQQYLESLLRSRGYSTQYYDVLNSAYYNKPTPLQEASYGVFIVDVVRRNDSDMLENILALGLSPNACNCYGESLVHLACRRGNFQALQTMIDFQCNIQVSDDYGRTPLHDLCWALEPSFQSAAILLEIDSRLLFMKDCRGSSPLSYARQEHWAAWIKFLESRKDEYWPKRHQDFKQGPPPLTEHPANSRPIPNPENALCTRLATLVAGGKMSLEEAEILKKMESEDKEEGNPEGSVSSESEDSDDDDDDDVSDSDANEDSMSSFFDDDEMNDIIGTLEAMKASIN